MIRRGFTLVEMLLAVTLSALLIAALLIVLGGVSRDRRLLQRLDPASSDASLIERLRWDLVNARTMTQSDDALSFTLVGHGAIDSRSLAPTGRLVSVTYRCENIGKTPALIREQESLDDPARPQRWRETVAWDISQIALIPVGSEAVSPNVAVELPQRVHVRIEGNNKSIDRELWLK